MRSLGMGRTKSRYADDAKACRLGCRLQLSPCAPKGRDSCRGLNSLGFFSDFTRSSRAAQGASDLNQSCLVAGNREWHSLRCMVQ